MQQCRIFEPANKDRRQAKHATKMKPSFFLQGLCSTVLPAVHADLCDDQAYYGEISRFLFTRLGDDLTDWTDDAEWVTRINNATALPVSPTLAPIRDLFGIGSISDPELPSIRLSRARTKYGKRKFTLIFDVDDTGNTNWAFLQALPAGGQVFACWFATEERMWGGNTGVEATVVATPSIPASAEELIKIKLTVTWETVIPSINDNVLP